MLMATGPPRQQQLINETPCLGIPNKQHPVMVHSLHCLMNVLRMTLCLLGQGWVYGNGPFRMVWCGHQQNDAPVPLGGVKTVSEVASPPCLYYQQSA